MEISNDVGLKKCNDNINLMSKSPLGATIVKSEKLKESKRTKCSSSSKLLQRTQSSTINTWLKKESFQKPSWRGNTMILNDEDVNKNCNSVDQKLMERGGKKKKVKKKSKKYQQQDGSKDRVEESTDNINNNMKEQQYDGLEKNIESLAKKKYKRITSQLSLTNSINRKLNESKSPQTNTIDKWIDKHDNSITSDTSNSNSVKEKNYTKVHTEITKYKFSEKENTNSVTKETKINKVKPKKFLNFSPERSNTVRNKCKAKETDCGFHIATTKRKRSEDISNSPINIQQSMKPSPVAPVPRKLFDCDIFSQTNPTNTWLSKQTRIQNNSQTSSSKPSEKTGKAKYSSKKFNKLHVKINSKQPKELRNNSKKKKNEQTLHNYLKKNSKELTMPTFSRSESNESCDFPSFVNNDKKSKSALKRNIISDTFKKYGVAVPSVDEILKEQQDLVQYKNQIESFEDVDEKFFDLPFSIKNIKDNQIITENILGCKHLPIHDIEDAFKNNLEHISNIFYGKIFNERHERFFDANSKNYTFTVKDLCYNTSTIIFNFEQKEHMIQLLKKEFDPHDKWTLYFFQVLLPELCLKIFMDTHNMAYDEAVKYLDTRPIIDD